MAQQGLDDISRCSGFEPSGGRRVAKHVWAQAESKGFGEPLKELLGIVVSQWLTQRRLVKVDENKVTAVTLGYLGFLELVVGVELESNCQYLWIKIILYAASFGVVSSSGRSTSLPFSNRAPARTSATRCGAFTARQRDCAASISL